MSRTSIFSGHDDQIKELIRSGMTYREVFEVIFEDPFEERYCFSSFATYISNNNLTKHENPSKEACKGCPCRREVEPCNPNANTIIICSEVWKQVSQYVNKPYWCPKGYSKN